MRLPTSRSSGTCRERQRCFRAGIEAGEGIVPLNGGRDLGGFIDAAKGPRIWSREVEVEQRLEVGAGRKEGAPRGPEPERARLTVRLLDLWLLARHVSRAGGTRRR